jgi:biotin--protein ligase
MQLKIYLYCGEGVGSRSLLETKNFLSSYGLVEEIDAKGVILGSWANDAALFVIPGGADLPYCQLLNGAGNKAILEYVREGGAYLGICAGSYYAGNFVEFAKGTDLEILGPRELAFFSGTVEGPTFWPFPQEREVVLASPLIEKEAVCHYAGGGHFRGASLNQILARYVETGDAAIIECQAGRGGALLSSVHLERDNGDLGRLALAQALMERILERPH